jgi:hypothetical protein
MWWGDAATFLTSFLAHHTEGGSEKAYINQSFNAFTSSQLYSHTCQGGDGVWGVARSIFIGTPSLGKLARFTGSKFIVHGGNTLNLGVFTDQAMCYLDYVGGKFRGGGEAVRLYKVPSGGRQVWHAQATQGGAGEGIRGEGRCFLFHQWDH